MIPLPPATAAASSSSGTGPCTTRSTGVTGARPSSSRSWTSWPCWEVAPVDLKRVAWSNVWRNLGRYAAYLGSAAFAVMVYFLFNAVVLHPDFQGGYRGARTAAQAMQAGAVVVAAFTFFFLLFAHAAFIRFRRREFGLLRLMGFTRGQLVRLLLWEGLITALAALAISSGLGLLFARLFFMAISVLLQLPEPIPAYTGPGVWLRTIAVFGAIFTVVSLQSIREVMKHSIAGLLRA